MLKERLYFLKRDLLLAIFLTILALFFGEGPLSYVISESSNLSVNLYWIFIGFYWICVFIGFFRFKFDYLGRALLFLYFTISSFSYIVLILIGSTSTISKIKLADPFNYFALLLYFMTALYLCLSFINKIKKTDKATTLQDMLQNVNSTTKTYYADLADFPRRKLDPRKQKISMWLTVITQVVLVKMTWDSGWAQSLIFIAIGLLGSISLIITIAFFTMFQGFSQLEIQVGCPLKPALRKPFSLKQWIIDGQKNSY